MLPGSNLEIQIDLAYKHLGLIVEFVPRVKFNKGSVPHARISLIVPKFLPIRAMKY